ncbi:glycosyl transferase family 2 [Candidatus Magnetobacterium bavaricum]|uniref:Glycosyl transferase family 2 n=1 Tax=Candidatus Magnetobacterium bavaricum TaxID=29290 RepID=A0A0F3GM71_9BACT|nr:glycosyl transferase family 2 [Candidatus Magnetobacterium bavaricum]
MRVSVIVPAYNAAATIGKCMEGLFRQTFNRDDYEVIVVDDGSEDATVKCLGGFPVKLYRQPNRGPAAARNHGAGGASGDILLFTDSDCVCDQSWIQEMLKPFETPNIAAVKGVYRNAQTSLTSRFAQVEFEERYELLKKSAFIDMVDTYSAAIKREVFEGIGGFDEGFPRANNEDTELSYRLCAAGHKMVFNPNAIVYHLNHPASILKYARQKFWRGYWRMVVYRRYPKKMFKDSYTPQSLKLQILTVFALLFSLALVPVYGPFLYASLFLAAIYVVLTLGFVRFAFSRDRPIGLLSTFYLALRAISIGCGVLYFFKRWDNNG